ncbi:MAG TPA: dihydrolipoyllysine-residue acetyltransferase [Rudaea sp.]|nr:dihydrolipoyllysine-residue acetyltransferase [Rudaea sp.]
MGQITEIKVPDIGNYENVPVIEVLVKAGDTVAKDQGLLTLESDKATMEVPSSAAGVVKEVKVKVGDEVSEGTIVVTVEAGEAAEKPAAAPKAEAPKPESKPEAPTANAPKESAPKQAEKPAPAETKSTIEPPRSPPIEFGAGTVMPDKVPYASPAIRLFARELGVDLTKVKGSARNGRITKEDVQNFVKQALTGSGAGSVGGGTGLNLLPWPKVDFSKFGEVETKPLSKIKRISGANLARNWVMIPHVTQHDDADITDLETLRVALNKEHEKAGIKFTMLGFIIKAVVAGLKKYPDFNASLDATGDNLVLKKYFHVGFAADTPNGLVVPVLKDADKKGLVEIATETTALAGKAREGKLGPAEMSGGCFSISSLGGIGGTAFTPIVNAPEVAILGVSKSATKPVWDGKAFQPRLILPLSLSYDHRVIDGASAARFTAFVAQVLGDMRRAML